MATIEISTKTWSIFNSRVIVVGYGAESGINWSMKLVENDITSNTPGPRSLALISKIHGTTNFWSPTPTACNAVIAEKSAFIRSIPLPNGGHLYRGADADGVIIEQGQGYCVSPADCLTVYVMTPGGELICSHAGRDSIIDIPGIVENKPKEAMKSIAVSLGAKMSLEHRKQALVHFGFSGTRAGSHYALNPDNPKYPNNNKVINYLFTEFGDDAFARMDGARDGGWIDLSSILWHQLIEMGFSPENIKIDTTCTYQDKPGRSDNGVYDWHSNSRNTGTELAMCRNLIVAHFVN